MKLRLGKRILKERSMINKIEFNSLFLEWDIFYYYYLL